MIKNIGFDCTEDHRVKGGGSTYAVPKSMNIAPDPELPHYKDRYIFRYPLREWGMDRKACGQTIADAGLPIPPKSACFFCPAMRQIEIRRLREIDPDQYALALAMEDLYRSGHHFRGDDFFTVNAVRKDTGEKEQFECFATDTADARMQFRAAFDDTAQPYRYKVRVSPSVRGLGRDMIWGLLEEVA